MTNALFRISLVLLAMACTGLNTQAADRPAPRPAVKVYSSLNHEGVIGTTIDVPVDNPADNIFHVQIDEPLCGDEKLWLVYDLEGVQDHTSVSRSINDQLSTGGYLVKMRRGWATQREQISASWLKQGDNIVRFTTPEQAQHSYRIRNLRIEASGTEQQSDDIQIIINQPSGHYYSGKGYIKGLITGAGNGNVKISVDGKPARISNGEFESIVDLETTGRCAVEIEAVHADGTTTCHAVSFEEPLTPDFVFQLDAVTHRKERLFEASQAGTVHLQGASLTAPAEALGVSSLLSITTLRDVDIPALDDAMVNVTGHHAGFRLLPHGTVFGKEVNIRIPYDAGKIPDGYTEDDIRTYYFDEQAHHWVPLKRDTVLTASPEVVSHTLHFTDYINAIIKVPESPEVEAYNSTSMKGVKAANPTTSVNLINPPQANNTGSAALNFPLSIPAGRKGVQPQLTISYNSGAGNGWMGLGWTLNIPAISIDTRWGVPRYDPLKETETYTLNGDQLTPVAHRGTLEPRSTGNKKEFYPRVEGAFNKITRYGNNPTNYWWEVIDKNGTRYFYGATKNGGFDKTAVLRDNEEADGGNIAYWALREIRDLNGNGVTYHYAKPMDTGLAPAVNEEKGYQLYIDRITYTEYNGADGRYQVLFTRDREVTSPAFERRKDVVIAGNLGFKQVTADLLVKIEVQFEGKPIRHYQLNYQKNGTSQNFYKTLLTSISEYDAAGAHFNTHTFDYYNDVAAGGTFRPLNDIPAHWNPQDDGIHGDFINPFDLFNDDASALSGTKSSDFSQGLAVTVGSATGSLWSKCNTIGGNFGIGRSKSEGMLTMIDINGDGLSDKVYLEGGVFKYRPNLLVAEGNMEFGDEITVSGAGTFLKEKSKSTNWGLQAIGCYGGGSANIGKSWSNSTSTTSVYFTDANGDQLPDIVKNGVVYFNHIDPATGKISFQPSSGSTPNPIETGGSVGGGGTNIDETALAQARAANPLHDMVRMWQAPYTGKIKISGPVQLLQSGDPERSENPADGVKATIQHQDSYIGNSITINQNDYQEHGFSGVDNIQVTKGDRIFFRLQSVDNGSYDSVRWSPLIEYLEEDNKAADLKLTDANRKPLYRFSSEKDFLLSAEQQVAAPVAGKVMVTGAFKKPFTTDDVRFQIIRTRPSAPDVMVFDKTYKWNVEKDSAIAHEVDVAKDDIFLFKVYSSTNVDYTAISWTPHVYYTVSNDPVNKTVLDKNGKPLVNFYPVPNFTTYPLLHSITRPWKLAEDVEKITVTPSLAINNGGFPVNLALDGIINFSVKKKDTLVWKTSIQVVNGELPPALPSAEIEVKQGDTLYFEYNADMPAIAGRITQYDAKLNIAGSEKTVKAGVFSAQGDEPIFGPFYRGWGHFAYNGNPDRADRVIDRGLLKISDMAKNAGGVDVENDIENPEDVEGANAYDPAKEMFIMLVPSGEKRNWLGYDNLTILTGTVMSSSRLGEDDIMGAFSVPGGGNGGGGITPAIDKVTKTSGSSFGLGIGYKAIGGGYNSGSNDTEVLSDFMDMNGDRFPDVVTKDFIQFTDARGILSEPKPHGHGNHHVTKSISQGASLSGTMVESKASSTSSNIRKALVSIGNAAAGNGLSADYGEGTSEVPFSWLDINGDGLPDKVRRNNNAGPKPEEQSASQNLKVSLNLGYKFGKEETWQLAENHISGGSSVSYGGGVGFSFASGSINAGIGASRSENETTGSLEDINGDGLVDELLFKDGEAVKVKLNTGAGFQSAMEWSGADHINKNRSTSESTNIAFTGCIPIPVIGIRICINPSTSVGHGVSRELTKFTDVNGDGYPDFVHSEKDNELVVKHSTIGRTNLLKSVHRPLGASFTMSYSRLGNTYRMPNGVWVMDSVQVSDGFAGDGVDNTLITYAYEEGFHDRREREFYGFKKVTTRTHDTSKDDRPVYTMVTQTFANDNYYEKGLLLHELMTDGAGNKYVEKQNTYKLKNIFNGNELTAAERASDSGNAFPALTETHQKFYEGQSEVGKSATVRYAHNRTGDVTTYTDLGDDGSEDDLTATISYHNLENLYVITPETITITGSGTTYRKRESVIDPNTGDVVKIKQYLSDSEVAVHDMEYDQYGNLKKMTRPQNAKGQRLSVDYVYDDKVYTYTTKVSNSYGYSSEATYDLSYGQLLLSKDMNGNEIAYELDKKGRVVKITGPYEKSGGGYTLRFTYNHDAAIPFAVTEHFDTSDPKNPLKTVIFTDGLGRVLQTKKDVAIYQGDGKADVEMMAVSGRVTFDAFGRIVNARYPVTAPAATPGDFVRDPDGVDPTITAYDVLNRVIKVTLPDKSVTLTEYGFEQDKFGRKQFSTRNTDANGKQTEQFTDVRGLVTSVKNHTSDKPVWTSFRYNAINEQIEATDDLGHTTFSAYDNLGRRISRKHPDAGTTTYSYDLAGNLKELVTANLQKEGQAIIYGYDFERLTEITYPENPENNVKFTYGAAGATDNRVGRLVLQEDASGAQEFFYGALGEVVKNIRTVVIPQHDEQTYVTEWKYDTWNRLTSMTYADGEEVTYAYNSGGLLRSMMGKKKNATYNYVNQLGYDKFEQRVFLAYGNGTKTTYAYEPDRRRLQGMTAATAAKRLFMDNTYTYDKVNNILGLKNSAPVPSANLMGGQGEYSYEYDDLYRLTKAEGAFKGPNDMHTYTLSLEYNSVGGITHKVQNHQRKGNVQKKTTYDLSYTYGSEQPHAPIHIGEHTYSYDANGNQTGWTDDKTGQRRNIMWDEENRIRSIYDNGSQHHYIYDASGERVIKGKSTGQRVFVNGEWKAGSGQMGNYTVYVNPYLVLKSGSYTKHYYIEGQRIVSKLGGGWDNNGKGPLKAGGSKVDYVGKAQRVFDGIVKNLKFLSADGQILTAGKSGKVPPGQINSTGGNVAEPFRYFYHPDHLGSTSYVTDATGEVYQHMEYFAFGETFVEEHSNTDRTPYLFNGKELDEETGLYYYGIRYYDPRTSVWLAVDPKAEKFPAWSPYNYCLNNPIAFVDAFGEAPTPYPRSGLGSPDYYQFRYQDFRKQNPNATPPDYYLNYGDKYIKRFTNETNKTLSLQGKDWLVKARRNLQVAIEDKLQADPTIELRNNGADFKTFAFDSHVDAYWNAGLYKLETLDLVKILLTPDAKDLFSEDGLKQVAKMSLKFLDYYKDNPSALKQRLIEAFRDRKEIQKLIEEKAKKEGVPVEKIKKLISPIPLFEL